MFHILYFSDRVVNFSLNHCVLCVKHSMIKKNQLEHFSVNVWGTFFLVLRDRCYVCFIFIFFYFSNFCRVLASLFFFFFCKDTLICRKYFGSLGWHSEPLQYLEKLSEGKVFGKKTKKCKPAAISNEHSVSLYYELLCDW